MLWLKLAFADTIHPKSAGLLQRWRSRRWVTYIIHVHVMMRTCNDTPVYAYCHISLWEIPAQKLLSSVTWFIAFFLYPTAQRFKKISTFTFLDVTENAASTGWFCISMQSTRTSVHVKVYWLEIKRDKHTIDKVISKPFFEFSTTSTPNWTISPDLISFGALSSEPLLSRTLFTKVPLLLLVSCKKY